MVEISGYPDVETVGILGWTNATRPKKNPNDNYLLGYNTQTGQLELVGSNGSVLQVISDETKKSIALLAHPVGSYFYTSESPSQFNPATAWGGTWEQVTDGRVLIASSSKHALGSTGGEEEHTLTKNEIPEHDHEHTHKHRHGRGTMDITGTFPLDDHKLGTNSGYDDSGNTLTGAFYYDKQDRRLSNTDNEDSGNSSVSVSFSAAKSWSGYTTYDETKNSSALVGSKTPKHNNMQPYTAVTVWHRTA